MPFTRQHLEGSNPPALAEGLLTSPPNRTSGSGGGLQQADPPPAPAAGGSGAPPTDQPTEAAAWERLNPAALAVWLAQRLALPAGSAEAVRLSRALDRDGVDGRELRALLGTPGVRRSLLRGWLGSGGGAGDEPDEALLHQQCELLEAAYGDAGAANAVEDPCGAPRRSRLQPLCRRPMECSRRFHAHRAV